MSMQKPPVKPGIPMGPTNGGGSVDAGMPTATEIAEAEARKRNAREDTRPVEEQVMDRYSSIDQARGGKRGDTWSNDEWDEAAAASDPEKRQRIRDMLTDSVLPNLPKKDGFHRCWVSTTHNIDTPQRRLRLGYWFYKLEDARGEEWHADEYAVTDAQSVYKGCIMWREMVAMEITYADYCMIMREVHHDMPMDQARSIYESLDAAGQQIRDMGGRTTMAPGMETLRQITRPPRQFEIFAVFTCAALLALQMLPLGSIFY